MNPATRPLFTTITDADWRRELPLARARKNPLSEEIREKLKHFSEVPLTPSHRVNPSDTPRAEQSGPVAGHPFERMNTTAALQAHGIMLRPWHRNVIHQMFRWSVFDGLLLATEEVITIVAIMNDTPGSGKLGHLMDRFEQAADDAQVPIVVVHFWNPRLQTWFGRRGYAVGETKSFGRFALREVRVTA